MTEAEEEEEAEEEKEEEKKKEEKKLEEKEQEEKEKNSSSSEVFCEGNITTVWYIINELNLEVSILNALIGQEVKEEDEKGEKEDEEKGRCGEGKYFYNIFCPRRIFGEGVICGGTYY